MANRFFANVPGCLILFAGLAFAQADKAVLTGTATDASGAVLAGSVVEISSPDNGFLRKLVTSDVGTYYIPGLTAGIYEVVLRKDGFRTERVTGIKLEVGQTRTLNLQLAVAGSNQEVNVEAAADPLEQTSAEVGGVLSGQQVGNLPVNGRSWTSLMALIPGAIDSGGSKSNTIRFAGRGTDDTNYRFDGLDASGISAQSPNASLRLQISTESIAEFRVDSALYGADNGGTAGGQVEVISKSGSNQFHGGVFEYVRNNFFDARTPFDPHTLPPLRLNQFGATVGGPILKDKLFFFASYEGLRQRQQVTLIGTVPSASFRAAALAQSPALAPLLAAFPAGTSSLSANVDQLNSLGSNTGNEDSGLMRLDYRPTETTTLFARFNIDEALLTSPSGTLRDLSQSSSAPLSGSVQMLHVFSASMFNQVQLGVNRIWGVSHTESSLFDTSKIFNSLSVPGFTKLSQASDSVKAPTSYSILDNWSLTRGRHTIKAGVEIKQVNYNYSQASENALVYSSAADFLANRLNQVNLIGGVPTHGLHKLMDFAYVLDQWKIKPNLTANIGLRYEFFNRFHEIYGRDLPFDPTTCGGPCPAGSEFSYPVTKNFEPRASIAWSPKPLNERLVIRAGGGLYKGEGQLGDLNAPSDNYTQRLTLSSLDFPTLSYPADQFLARATNQAVTPRALQRDRQDPTVAQWGMQVQTRLPMGFTLDTGYLGLHGYHQFTRTYVNVINPLTGVRPISGYGQVDIKQADSNNSFNAWQTALQRRFRSGVLFAANYMWSHQINDASTGGGEAGYPENVACRTCEHATGDQDIRHTFTSNMVYELPFGRGRHFLNRGGIVNGVLGGWQFSGIGTFRSGKPVNMVIDRTAASVPDGNSDEHDSAPVQRPNYVGGSIYPAGGSTINNYFNLAAFAIPANGTWGNAGRNLGRGPTLWQADTGLEKKFVLTERFSFDFRAEAFNIFNRAQFGDPNGIFNTANFGRITTVVNSGATGSGTSRKLQFALRLNF
jgi:hypothetical protein